MLRSSASGFVPAKLRGNNGLDHGQQVSATVCEFAPQEPLVFFNMLPLCNIVSAIDGARNFSLFIPKRTDINDGGHARAIGPLADYFLIIDLQHFSGDYPSHRTFIVTHDTSIRTEHFDRAAETFAVIPLGRGAAPQLRSTLVEILNDALGITGIDSRRT